TTIRVHVADADEHVRAGCRRPEADPGDRLASDDDGVFQWLAAKDSDVGTAFVGAVVDRPSGRTKSGSADNRRRPVGIVAVASNPALRDGGIQQPGGVQPPHLRRSARRWPLAQVTPLPGASKERAHGRLAAGRCAGKYFLEEGDGL